ncbi:hypothetical protein NQZ68_000229 [Dissostichus eleginoides]|nr:hypothetical protein NQZ68_000229 [Dissostichus eleginoides]
MTDGSHLNCNRTRAPQQTQSQVSLVLLAELMRACALRAGALMFWVAGSFDEGENGNERKKNAQRERETNPRLSTNLCLTHARNSDRKFPFAAAPGIKTKAISHFDMYYMWEEFKEYSD